ncbi:tRNA (uridine(34)/cytosine(34)/5-carboxymethylaminomethyluridine(34)-2'-O)-methyltransferase TrmL [Paenibacillus sp. N4]|uniref:tRNA (uridine(34)/cytosine(34)/5- carboxymethylaminomethyluridine(34)-2'-O)- methyltransferase TrmL n=1 Tax=Paenibacillus vietnamensis TaxID=2590547 RepID=UPI001CD0ABB5|nr:tRNA (uridine(34)/cytosine(34)/5-carboxymethylaminomethyluridine(34)-2'-O)-methyltransferase TrmL [Paenibacillus vietnamensis]MCA0755476.1 tRNA (uridine(34)/cytosine(34)/5-carboxymethylaminomethyluridine(34)-2'-O)-methyltransferase TrmL [Paenibacillus vietnamensis]
MPFHIVLVEPEIPANTGNIARTCAATGTHLHLVRPLGFDTDDRTLKRAGLDYWHAVQISYYDSFDELRALYPEGRFFYASTRATKVYSEFEFKDGDFFVFGKETKGLPQALIDENLETCIRMPMRTDHVRSLNLSNSAAIIVYEALRQNKFPDLH